MALCVLLGKSRIAQAEPRLVQIPDTINGSCEIIGGLLVLNHCRAVLRDKAVAGISIPSTIMFMFWGFWNLYYYPALGQWLSFSGGVLICVSNMIWLVLLVKYRKNKIISER